MREIKFRAWHKNSRIMYWFDLLWGNTHGVGSGYIGMLLFGNDMKYTLHNDNRIPIDPAECELIQYTGLKDKNGKEIYEGDIVKYTKFYVYGNTDGVTKMLTVEFYKGSFTYMDILTEPIGFQAEVVGNIYENPELLGYE